MSQASSSRDRELFRRGATRLIALHGGWNHRSRRAVLWLAARHGLDASDIAGLLTADLFAPAGDEQETAALAQRAVENRALAASMGRRRSEVSTERSTALLSGLFVASLVSLVLSIGLAIIVLPGAFAEDSQKRASSSSREAEQSEPGERRSEPAETTSAPIVAEAAREGDEGRRGVAAAAEAMAELAAASNPEAASALLGRAQRLVADAWVDGSADQRRVWRQQLVRAFQAVLASPAVALRGVDVLEASIEPIVLVDLDTGDGAVVHAGCTSSEMARALLAAEVLAELDRRAMPAWLLQRLRVLSSAIGGEAESGLIVEAAMVRASRAIATPADGPGQSQRVQQARAAWEQWIAWARTTAAEDTREYSRQYVSALSVLALEAPDPDASQMTREMLRVITGALGWKQGSLERQWLTRALVDEAVTAEELYVITSALVAGLVQGVTTEMIVQRDATMVERSSLQSVYRAAWGMDASFETEGFERRWLDISDRAMPTISAADSESAQAALQRAVAYGYLSAAAASAQAGDFDAADEALTIAASRLSSLGDGNTDPRAERFDPVGRADAGNWAMRFLELPGDTSGRLALISRFPQKPDVVDAEVLIEAALRDSSAEVRAAASDRASLHAGEPAIVNALLEEAPRMPRTAAASSLVASISLTPQLSRADPQWRERIRRVLVERLHELIGQQSQGLAINRLSQELAAIAAQRSGIADEDRASDDPLTEVTALVGAWQRRVESAAVTTEAASEAWSRSLTRRLGIASNDPQRYVAHQMAVGDLMVRWLELSRPDVADAARQVRDEHFAEADASTHVLQQIAVLEMLAVRLWRLTMEELA